MSDRCDCVVDGTWLHVCRMHERAEEMLETLKQIGDACRDTGKAVHLREYIGCQGVIADEAVKRAEAPKVNEWPNFGKDHTI